MRDVRDRAPLSSTRGSLGSLRRSASPVWWVYRLHRVGLRRRLRRLRRRCSSVAFASRPTPRGASPPPRPWPPPRPPRPPALRCWLALLSDAALPATHPFLFHIATWVRCCCCLLSALCVPLAGLRFGCVCVAPPGFRFGRGGFLICCSGDAFLPDITLKITSSGASPTWDDPHVCAHSCRYILLH